MKITASMNDKSQQQQQQEAYFAAAAAAMLPFLTMQQQPTPAASTASTPSSATAFAQHFLNELSNPNANNSFLTNLYLQNQPQQQQLINQSSALNQLACLNMLNELSKTTSNANTNNNNKGSNYQTNSTKNISKPMTQNSNNAKQNQTISHSSSSNQVHKTRQVNEANIQKSANNQQPQVATMNKNQKPFNNNHNHGVQRNTDTHHNKQQFHPDSLSSSPSSSLSFSSSSSNSRKKEANTHSGSSSFSINNLISNNHASTFKTAKKPNNSGNQATSQQPQVKNQSSVSSLSKPSGNIDYISSLFGAGSNGNPNHQATNSSFNNSATTALAQSTIGNLNKNDLNLLNMLAALNSFGGMANNNNTQSNLSDPSLNYLNLLNSLNPLLLGQDLSQSQTAQANISNGKKLKDSTVNANSPHNNTNNNQATNRVQKVSTHPKDTEMNQTQTINVKNAINKSHSQQTAETFEPPQQDKIRKPLKLGWRRETFVKDVTKNGINGVVIYTSPCMARIRTMNDVEQYLKQQQAEKQEKIPPTQLNISNFSFNSNKIVGTYLVPKELNLTAQTSQGKYIRLSEKQILVILNEHTKFKPKAMIDENEKALNRKESREQTNGDEKHLPPNIKAEKLYPSQQEREMLIQKQQQKQLELELQLKMEQQRQLEQLNEAKRLQNERRTREKWFEFIMLREQQQSVPSNVHLIDENSSASLVYQPFEPIDDMQERFGKKMPAFKQLHLESQGEMDSNCEERSAFCLDWFGDALQVIEFVKTFGDKISQGIEETNSELNDFNVTFDAAQFEPFLSNVEQFRAGLDNRSEKLRKDFLQIVLLLIKAAINNSTKPKSDSDDEEIEDENEEENEELVEANSNSKELTNQNGDASLCAPKKEPNSPEDDEIYLMNKLSSLECNESTYSELIRLYLKRSLLDLNKRRATYSFNSDVTQGLHDRLAILSEALELRSFESLDVAYKANILAYLCDELLQTGYYEISNAMTSSSNANGVDAGASDEAEVGPVARSVDEAIDELNEIKREKWALESQIRQIKVEKLSAIALPELNKNEPIEESEKEKALEKQKKIAAQYDKKLAQIEKKREQLKDSYETSANKLRAGIHCGQDRFMRHYWSLSNCGGLFVESASQAGPSSLYMAYDSQLLVEHHNDVNQVMQSILDRVEFECDNDSLNSAEMRFVNDSQHLIERFTTDDPFKFTLKFDHPDMINLTFRQIELLVKDQIQHKYPMSIADIYLTKNANLNTSSCWWFCDNMDEWKQLRDCLSVRGYRERALAKVITKLGEGENTNEFAVSNQSLTQSFEKGNMFLKEFFSNQESIKEEQQETETASEKRTTGSNRTSQNEQREKNKLLKQVYSLEDKVFNANLHSSLFSHTDDDKEDAVNVAKKRLLDLEKRIERRYLKYPFACKKDYSNFNFENKFDGPKEKLIEAIKKNTVKIKLNEKCAYDLEVWRRLVQNATSCSQLAILTIELNKHIAWNKSIMKVICQICNCDDNEDKLLLCDYCDCGFHTYCFKPTLKTIPEGDWYCYICISKFLNDESLCCVCGSTKNPTDIHKCNKCKKLFHSECMPNAKCFKTTSKWHCLNCHNLKPKATSKQQQQVDISVENGKKRKLKEQTVVQSQTKTNSKKSKMSNKDSLESQDDDTEMDTETEAEPSKKKGKKLKESAEIVEEMTPVANKKNNRPSTNNKKNNTESIKKTPTAPSNKNTNNQEPNLNQKPNSTKTVFLDRDFQKCRNLFNEMCRNEHAWPFQEKVDEKDYPDYYELIKEPMDLQTIRNKLKNKDYETKEQFAYDCRLIFDNCEYFNEDESDVGQAGYKLRAFFETKWMKLFD